MDFATSIAVIGHIGADDIPDLVISAPNNQVFGASLFILQPIPDDSGFATHGGTPGSSGAVSWGVASKLTPVAPMEVDSQNCSLVTAVGDVNGDGIPDFVALCDVDLYLFVTTVSAAAAMASLALNTKALLP